MRSRLLRFAFPALLTGTLASACASTRERTLAAEAWVTSVSPALTKVLAEACPLRQSQPVPFAYVKQPAHAEALLQDAAFVALSRDEAERLASLQAGLVPALPFLVRAVRMVPPDGVLTVTACGGVLYVNYTGAPSYRHYALERLPVVAFAPLPPTHLVVTYGQGIP